jgi:hypothetical protein
VVTNDYTTAMKIKAAKDLLLMAVSGNSDGTHWMNERTSDKLKEQKHGYAIVTSECSQRIPGLGGGGGNCGVCVPPCGETYCVGTR